MKFFVSFDRFWSYFLSDEMPQARRFAHSYWSFATVHAVGSLCKA